MDISLFKLCEKLGIPPKLWMIKNPFKIYDFSEVTKGAGLQKEHVVLDFGCGKGHWTVLLANKCKLAVGIDVSSNKLEQARNFIRHSALKKRIRFISSRLEEANLDGQSFDRILSFCVLEHVDNLDEVLLEMLRLLKPGGELHVSVDSLASVDDRTLLLKHKEDNYVFRYFTNDSLRSILENAGFEIMSVYPIFTGEFARKEFEKRIQRSYKKGLFERFQLVRRFLQDDATGEHKDGIMLVARARKPATGVVL